MTACLAGVAVLTVACSASNPVAPIDLTAAGIFLAGNRSVTVTTVTPGGTAVFRAFAVTRDGGYRDVTSLATWTGSDLLRPTAPGTFTAVNTGDARVTARYEGVEGSLPMFVLPANRLIYPSLSMIDPGYVRFGDRIQLTAVFQQSQSDRFQTLVDGVTWTSSDPAILRITGRDAEAVAIGTTLLTVEYGGLTNRFYFSVFPR